MKTTHVNIRKRRRSGYLYLAVLMVSLMVSVSGMAAVSVLYSGRRGAKDGADWLRARSLADSAIAHGLSQINADSSWRSTYAHAVESPAATVGNGTMTFRIEDSDGDLDDDEFDPAVLYGIGRVGDATYVRRAKIEPAGSALKVLEASVGVRSSIYFDDTVFWSLSSELYSGGAIAFYGPISLLSCDIRAASWLYYSSSFTYGDYDSYVSERSFPHSSWPAYYEQVATEIAISDLPESGGYRTIQNSVLHAGHNPFGSPNALGIYRIDCDGEDLRISDSRLAATLLIENPGPNSRLLGSVYWEPGLKNFPILLVKGDFQIQHDSSPLSESVITTNLNPVHFPYYSATDSDLLDEYPSRLRGLIYVSGHLEIGQGNGIRAEVEGTILCNSLDADGDLQVVHQSELISDPPPGFRDASAMKIVEGSFQRWSAELQ